MKTLQVDQYGLEEMDLVEMKETNGGIVPWVAGALVAATICIINNWGDIREGFSDGNSGKPPRY